MSPPELPGSFWLIGCGNMAGAMLDRWLECGIDRSKLTVIRPSGKPVGEDVRVVTAFPQGEVPAVVMLGTKPQTIGSYADDLARLLDPETIVISILAGIELASLQQRFPASRNIIKAMPNTPVKIGKGVTTLFSQGEDEAARHVVDALMGTLGAVEWFDDEQTFEAAGILSGAGPAFLFRYIDALARAGEAIGLDADQAARLVGAMVEGASALAAKSEETPAQLAERVASPGGVTRAGLNVLDDEGALDDLARRTLAAGLARSREMAEEARAASS